MSFFSDPIFWAILCFSLCWTCVVLYLKSKGGSNQKTFVKDFKPSVNDVRITNTEIATSLPTKIVINVLYPEDYNNPRLAPDMVIHLEELLAGSYKVPAELRSNAIIRNTVEASRSVPSPDVPVDAIAKEGELGDNEKNELQVPNDYDLSTEPPMNVDLGALEEMARNANNNSLSEGAKGMNSPVSNMRIDSSSFEDIGMVDI